MLDILEMTSFGDLQQLIITGIIILISQIIYSTLGFGSGMFAISILAFLYGDLDFIVPFFTLLCLPTEAYISFKDRQLINLRNTWIFLIMIIPALLLGSILLKNADNPIYLIILGSIIIILSFYYLFAENIHRFKLEHFFWIPFFGSISGIFGGLFGMAGPPLIFFFKHKDLTKKQFRASLLSIFTFMTLFRIIFYTALKIIDLKIIITGIIMSPFALAGLLLGYLLHEKIPEKTFKTITSIALAISGFIVIMKNF